MIPINFTYTYVTDKKIEKQLVKVGDSDVNGVTTTEKSATQGPKIYNFILNDGQVPLIDYSGLGDTGGIEQDKMNMKKAIYHIGYLKEIHGIFSFY